MDCNISGHNRAVSFLLDPECYAPSDNALDPINPVVFNPGCTIRITQETFKNRGTWGPSLEVLVQLVEITVKDFMCTHQGLQPALQVNVK